MAVTDIEIVNLALSDCGVDPITAFDDATPAARQAKAKYVPIRDAVLEDREWTFAKSRLLLAEDPNVPVFGYAYAYIIPSNVIRVCRCYQGQGGTDVTPPYVEDWVREGWRILTGQAAPVYAEVILRVGEGSFSPGMVLALAARLTSAFAIPLTENRQLAKDFMDNYATFLSDAAAMDGSQGRTQRLRPPALPGRTQNL